MKIKKILIAAAAAAVLEIIWGFVACGWLFNWVYAVEPVSVWKPVGEIPFVLSNVMSLVFAFFLVLVFAVIYKGLPGRGVVKGFWFGIFIWLVGALPGNSALGMFTVIAPVVILYWIISYLIFNILRGMVIASIYKETR